ncbi:MAG: hypothetical protein HYV15_05125 [Elusimicrobia bacterium]|nr:hypothetical protein [Elusimicrobiota bacterium]
MPELGPEKLLRLKDAPRWDPEDPCPAVVADEGLVHLAYYRPTREDKTAVLTFWNCAGHRAGPPAPKPGAWEVEGSPWVHERRSRAVEEGPEALKPLGRLRHFLFSFPESSFECLADGFSVKEAPGHTPLKVATDLALETRGV